MSTSQLIVRKGHAGFDPVRLSRKNRREELGAFVSLCFTMLSEYDFHDIAEMTRLHISTIRRLFRGQYTLAVRFDTIQRLGYVAKLKLEMVENKAVVRLID